MVIRGKKDDGFVQVSLGTAGHFPRPGPSRRWRTGTASTMSAGRSSKLAALLCTHIHLSLYIQSICIDIQSRYRLYTPRLADQHHGSREERPRYRLSLRCQALCMRASASSHFFTEDSGIDV